MTRKTESVEMIRFRAEYVRSMGIGGLIVGPLLAAAGFSLWLELWTFLLVGTGAGMTALGLFEYLVAAKVLKHLPAPT